MCKCIGPCDNKECGKDELCVEKEVACLSPPCNPVGECLKTKDSGTHNRRPCPIQECVMACRYGQKLDENNCTICECANICTDHQCPSDANCTEDKSHCGEGEACYPIPKCIQSEETQTTFIPSLTTSLIKNGEEIVEECEPENCQKPCPHGYKLDSKGCRTCECIDICKDVVCEGESYCKVEKDCADGHCIYYPECKEPVVCPQIICDSSQCAYGLKEVDGCAICDCASDPCQNVVCADRSVNCSTDCSQEHTCKPICKVISNIADHRPRFLISIKAIIVICSGCIALILMSILFVIFLCVKRRDSHQSKFVIQNESQSTKV
ncbi:DgyrCDS2023 [Dimorphilus gyrociliatus]|uniref:DgyrCDS2023 n=1 Tax=Dimorphilus gyrociliatus TaxID=2664684 RepID=A0A7I8VAD0_9ANNE|nr:DgyrCDS2023 [Dimorphilus gyrociliatus]